MKHPACFILWSVAMACRSPAPTPVAAHEAPPNAGCTGAWQALVDVNVLPMDAPGVLEHQTVTWCGETLAQVGPREVVRVPPGAQVVNAPGAYVMPGLWDMHTHLTRQQDLMLYVAHGVTTVRNMWGSPQTVAWREAVRQGLLPGPRIITAGPIVDGVDPVHDGSLVLVDPAQADAAVQLHQAQGYDFIKVYSRLGAPAFEALLKAATAAGLRVVGHVPREVGLERAVELGLSGVEHLDGTQEALQAADSPVRGRWDRASRNAKHKHVDPARIPPLAALLAGHGVVSCPTRVVKDGWGPTRLARAVLAHPAAALVPPCERAIWEPWKESTPEDEAEFNAEMAVDEAMVRALRDAHAPLVVGTDPGNPLIVPGHSVHDELAHLVRMGLTTQESLLAATRHAALAMGLEKSGAVRPGCAADLVILNGNPLLDITQTRAIRGVVVRGRHVDANGVERLKAEVAAQHVAAARDPFAGMAALPVHGRELVRAGYVVTWKDVPFGGEQLTLGEEGFEARNFDPHMGQWILARGDGKDTVELSGDGAAGRGHITLRRAGTKVTAQGTLLSGAPVDQVLEIPQEAALDLGHMMVGKALQAPRLMDMKTGETLELPMAEFSLGSEVTVKVTRWKVRRGEDNVWEFAAAQGKPARLRLDGKGNVEGYGISAFGATVQYTRMPGG